MTWALIQCPAGKRGTFHLCYSDLYHLLKHHHRPSTPLHCAPIPEAPQDPKDLLLVPLKPFVVMFKVTGVYLLFCFFNISFCSGLRIRVVLDTWLDFNQHVQNRDSESDALLTIAMFRLCFRRSRTNPLGVIFMPLKFQFKTQGSVYSSGPFPFLFEMIFFASKPPSGEEQHCFSGSSELMRGRRLRR